MREQIAELANRISSPSLRFTIEVHMKTEAFFEFPASVSKHHAYLGGLAMHTIEVAKTADLLCSMHPKADRDIVLTAALWHDYAKIWDYEFASYWGKATGDESFDKIPKRYVLVDDFPTCKRVYQENRSYKDKSITSLVPWRSLRLQLFTMT